MAPKNFICVCVCLSVCLAFTVFISLTTGRNLIKLCENAGTLIRLIVLKFYKNRLCVDVIMTLFLFFKIFSKGSITAQSKGIQLCAKGNNYAAPDTVTLVTAIFLYHLDIQAFYYHNKFCICILLGNIVLQYIRCEIGLTAHPCGKKITCKVGLPTTLCVCVCVLVRACVCACLCVSVRVSKTIFNDIRRNKCYILACRNIICLGEKGGLSDSR